MVSGRKGGESQPQIGFSKQRIYGAMAVGRTVKDAEVFRSQN